MGTNYISSIVKILETPSQLVFNKNKVVQITKCRAQLPQTRINAIVNLVFWGQLGQDITNYYEINDFIIVEGYVSFRDKKLNNPRQTNLKKVEITVLKVHPFLLKDKSTYSINKK